jgi:hypothetical protein
MKKVIVNFFMILGFFGYTTSLCADNLLQTSTGFYYPVNQKHSDSRYLGFGSSNRNYGNKCHLANDYSVDEGTKVHAVANGTIVKVDSSVGSYGGDTPSRSGGAIVIKHFTSEGKVFYALYGHLKNFKVSKDDVVVGGEYIGDVRSYYSGTTSLPHLHFGINSNTPSYTGYTPTSNCINYLGFVNPENFLKSNSPKQENIVPKTSGVFDGAGSLVCPNEDGFGCNKDIATMHPHGVDNSTVVFQWLYDEGSCSQLDIHSTSSIGDVIIKSKAWDGHLTKEAFKVRLNANAPITIKRPSTNVWTTLAITTTESLSSSAYIYATCKTSDDRVKNGIRSDIDKELVDVTHNYIWTGTGSLISHGTSRGSDEFGIDKDYAVTFDSKNSLTSFQWYASNDCSKLKITNARSSTINSAINEINIKEWDEENWSSNKCSSSLPCTIDAPNGNGFYVLKIKSNAGAIRFGTLAAQCVE